MTDEDDAVEQDNAVRESGGGVEYFFIILLHVLFVEYWNAQRNVGTVEHVSNVL